MPREPLRFKVAPHIVEDLGLNLYTNLPRVLVEFIANAYDADAGYADICYDSVAIEAARAAIRKTFETELAERGQTDAEEDDNESSPPLQPLATRILPANLTITINDNGIGMSRKDLAGKFLIAGRRRRIEDKKSHSPGGRLVMGRKGLGKLAGFGVAKVVTLITRKKGESFATKITLDYDKLIQERAGQDIEVPEIKIRRGGIKPNGTRIILSSLFYDPLKSRASTIEQEIAEHFEEIDAKDFVIRRNGNQIQGNPRVFAFAWPSPDLPKSDLVEHSLEREGGGTVKFRYRIRFTGKNEALAAARRGIRVYARHRLAAAPSLLSADTNMHGFRMTDYLDGVVHADFIEEEQSDYVATDRQNLRWESPLLSGLHEFLSLGIKEACKQYQKQRDEAAKEQIKEDPFTNNTIGKLELSRKDQDLAYKFAAVLEGACKRGVDDPIYQTKLPILIGGIGHGNILNAISDLSEQQHPDLGAVAIQIAKLTKDELGRFITTANTKLKAIKAFQKVVESVDFRKSKKEKLVQSMLETSPWLLDPMYTQFITANKTSNSLFKRLAQHLKIGEYSDKSGRANDDRPDLVFLTGNQASSRLIIVELKAPNVQLEAEHLNQLEYYMATAQKWLHDLKQDHIRVFGQLVGSLNPASTAKGCVTLQSRIEKSGLNSDWTVRDFLEVLEHTETAHRELIEIHREAEDKISEVS